ncbi:MAG: ATP-binding protein [Bacteroidales bacterium]|nr:ATP-binding protein [Bacteroidales bacterium]
MKDLSLHILDIIQNSLAANAKLIEISIDENERKDLIEITIKDDGKGMSKEFAESVTDPFTTTRTTRKVGLGIPLLKQNAERTGGCLTIDSQLGQGTIITAAFKPSNIDCPVLGDIAGVISLTVSGNPSIDFVYNHKINDNLFTFNTKEIKEVLGEIPINDNSVYKLLKELIQSNLEEIESIGYKT